MSYLKIIEALKGARINQAPYQVQVPCFLTKQENQEATVKEIALHLQSLNGGELKRYQSANPVYEVLSNKGVLAKTKTGYRLNGKFAKSELNAISKVCMERLK